MHPIYFVITFIKQQAAQAGQTIVATQPVTAAAVTPVIAATSVQKTVTGATPLITSVTAATVTQAARIQVSVEHLYFKKNALLL